MVDIKKVFNNFLISQMKFHACQTVAYVKTPNQVKSNNYELRLNLYDYLITFMLKKGIFN